MELEARNRLLQDIRETLTAGRAPESVTVRQLIDWFDAVRRGSSINWHIKRELEEAGIVTVPDFESEHIDGRIQFALPAAAQPAPQVAQEQAVANEQVEHLPPADEPVNIGGADGEPAYRVSRLLDPRIQLISVAPDATIEVAATVMLRHDFSQLPVMTNEREVRGIISWESLGPAVVFRNPRPCFVRDCMKQHVEVKSSDSLFRVINRIIESSYVLVRDDHRVIRGILTTTDLSQRFQTLAEPFLLLGEIENHVRSLIDGRFTREQLAAVKDQNDDRRQIESVADLTLGEHLRLLERPDNWQRLGLAADRAVFVRELDKVRELRNDIMHFDSDTITENERTSLRNFVQFLHDLRAFQARAQ